MAKNPSDPARLDAGLERSRAKWLHRGGNRPDFADPAGPGQESVWDYPRPPAISPSARRVEVHVGSVSLAATTAAVRVLETASPPTYYIPPDDIRMDLLEPGAGRSLCEWKGSAQYWNVALPEARIERAAWSYRAPFPEFAALRDYLAFYPALVACFVDGVRVRPQAGGFYGGWVTPDLVGPWKGSPGSESW